MSTRVTFSISSSNLLIENREVLEFIFYEMYVITLADTERHGKDHALS